MALNLSTKKALKEEIERSSHNDSLEAYRAHIDEKNRYRNLNRYCDVQRQEYELSKQLQDIDRKSAFNEQRLRREHNLARELDKIRHDEVKELKLRQQLRENCPELRELERKLKAAYVNKELAAQIAEKEQEKMNQMLSTKRTYEKLHSAIVEEEEFNRKMAQEEIIKKAQYKQELQDQMILKEKSKRYLYEEFLREKKMIDDIIQRIYDEDEREIVEKMNRMKRTRQEMMAFKESQEIWKKRKHDEILEENRKIQEYLETKAAHLRIRQEDRQKLQAAKAKLSEQIAKQIHEQQIKQQQREDIIQNLLEEESKETIEEKHKQEIEKQIRQRIEIRESLEKQMLEKQQKLEQNAAEEAKLREELLAKLAEDQKIEQMSNQRRRMKMLELKRDVEQMMVERRQKHAEEMQMLIILEEQEKAEMEQRKQIVEEERIRMLKDHVKNLIGFLPKGLLTKDDLPHIGIN